jgi:probable HAF family extracellular repeat protein
MKRILVACAVMFVSIGVFSLPSRSSGQQGQDSENSSLGYRLVDLGTLGGPSSYQPFGYGGTDDFLTEQSLSFGGTFAGWADTGAVDPYAPNCFFDCFVDHAFQWKDGARTDLGALPGAPGLSSAATWISSHGLISGFSENGEIDPLAGYPVFHGVAWLNGKIIDLKTLEGGYESWANSVNDLGQVVGFASNSIYDANSLQGLVTETRAFVWQNGVMKDLGTLGGTDAEALFINDEGQIVGQSYTNNSIPPPNAHCTDSPLTLHAFFWERGKMLDLGTLGGSCALAYALNNQGQVVGQATLDSDQEDHPFIWEQGKMKDLGTLGGTYGYASWLNDLGEVVGGATNKGDQAILAFHWKNDKMTNLGTLPGNACSVSDAINSSGQVVGGSGISESASFPACTDSVEHAFLSEGGRMIDLNSFVPDNSDLTLNEAVFINDHGEITGTGTLSNGNQHAFLLVPCQADEDGCEKAHGKSNRSAKQSGAAAIANPLKVMRVSSHPLACTRCCGSCPSPHLSVTLAGSGTGMVISDPAGINCPAACSASYKTGTNVHLTASPLTGSAFTGWSGACSGTGACNLLMNTPGKEVTATFNLASPGFSLTPAIPSLTVQPGGQVTDVITIAPLNGAFANAVQLACAVAGPAPLPSCAFSSTSVTPGANSTNSTLTITAATTSTALRSSRGPVACLLVSSVLLAMLGISLLRGSRRDLRACSVMFGFFLLILLQSACGSGSSSTGGGGGTLARNYTATVTGDSGSIQEKAQIALTVK